MATIEINQTHIDLMNKVCRILVYRTSKKSALPDIEELQSHALVVLWDLALSWDETRGIPFVVYLQMNGPNRMIDHVRTINGRDMKDKGNSGKLEFNSHVNSTDFEEFDRMNLHCPQPSTARIVEARDTLARVMKVINTECTPRQKDALLWPVLSTSSQEVVDKWGFSISTVEAHRFQGRARLCKALNKKSNVQKQSKRKTHDTSLMK